VAAVPLSDEGEQTPRNGSGHRPDEPLPFAGSTQGYRFRDLAAGLRGLHPVPVWPVSVCSQTTTNSSEVNK
jgi:hypothetical protein